MKTISFHKLAEKELNEATAYYYAARPALGEAFLEEVRGYLQSMSEFPDAGPVLLGSIRRKLTRRFPYALVYSVRTGEIRALAIMHLRRRPAYWLGRI